MSLIIDRPPEAVPVELVLPQAAIGGRILPGSVAIENTHVP